MVTLYGKFTPEQIAKTKKSLRGSIFFLLLCVDPRTSWEYENVDVDKSFEGLLLKLDGLNDLLLNPPEIVTTMCLLQEAWKELKKINNNKMNENDIRGDFNFHLYRKLILDAGAEIEKIKEGDEDAYL